MPVSVFGVSLIKTRPLSPMETVRCTDITLLFSIYGQRVSHDNEIEFLDENDEKLRFRAKQCGSGERLVKMGIYEPEGKCARCSACDYTAGLDNFPVYCIHAPIFSMVCDGKYPSHLWDFAEDVGSESCIITCYKDPTKIPEKYFERVGLKKPQL